MEVVELESKKISGLTIRTNNHLEINTEQGQIGQLWDDFYQQGLAEKALTGMYGVYFDYEDQDQGDYSVLAGLQLAGNGQGLEQIELVAGKYRVFRAEGELPDIIFETWAKIWEYFSNDECIEQRRFDTDFEWYRAENSVEIYIGIK